MKVDYGSFIASAASMIQDYGAEVSWIKPAPQAPDNRPWDDAREGEAPTFTPFMVFFSVIDAARGGTRGFFESFVKGMDVKDASQVGFLAGNCGFEPEQADTIITADETVWEIIAIDKIAPAGPVVMYFVSVR